MQLQTGTLLHQGEYRILSVLGQGGFGITYLGLQQGLERRVAIKEFFMKDLCNRQEGDSQISVLSEGARQQVDRFRQKFLKEAKTLAALDNPHIIRIHNVFEENGTAYYVMEYIEDGSLKDLVNARGSLPEAEALGYIRQLADALGYLHRQKILHLDLKPANVLLKGGQTAVLIDFGISKRYDEEGSQTSSTPAGISRGYAPLEQYNAGGVSRFQPCTDIYSLGATLYTLLTGKVPPAATDVNNDGLPALPPHISTSTARAIEKAMSPRPKDRPQSVEEFLELLGSTDKEEKEETKPIMQKKEEKEDTKAVTQDKKKEKKEEKSARPRKPHKIIGGVVAAIVLATGMMMMPFTKESEEGIYKTEGMKDIDFASLGIQYKNMKKEVGNIGYIGLTYQNDSLKTVVIPPKYDYINYVFHDGLAFIERDKKWGCINNQGQEVIPPKYDKPIMFNEGLAHVVLNGKHGYINNQRQEVIPLIYDDANIFQEGLAAVERNGKWGYVNRQGVEVIPLIYDDANNFQEGLAAVERNGKWGYVDKRGQEVIPLKCLEAHNFNDGLAKAIPDRTYRYINKQGQDIIPPKYVRVGEFREGLIPVQASWEAGGKWGYIDDQGQEIIPLKYDDAGYFEEGLAKVGRNGKWGYINRQGVEIIPLIYEETDTRSFSEGLNWINLNGKYGCFNSQGQEIIPPKYENALGFFEGIAAVKLNEKWGYINKQGQEITPPKYDDAWNFKEGLAKVKSNEKWGYINKQGQEVVPPKYDEAWDFEEGLAKVGRNGKWGYINKQGQEVIPPKYDYASDFCSGLAWVQAGNTCYLITPQGKRLLKVTIDGKLGW